MPITAPETALRTTLIELLEEEFKDDGFSFLDDALHPARASSDELAEDEAIGGVYPSLASERAGAGVVQETTVFVQLFGYWKKEITPMQTVSPAAAEEWAERIRRAVERASFAADAHLWYFTVQRIEYPKDPTGNITRLVATVVAHSDNAGIVETEG